MSRRGRITAGLAALSGLLLYASQPTLSFGFFAWAALAVLLTALSLAEKAFKAFVVGYTSGLFFFFPSLHWFHYVSPVGWLLAALIEALFIGGFALLVFYGRYLPSGILRILWTACAWTLMEWLRSEIPILAFGWNLLAYSQASDPVVLQTANAVGALGLGFGMALFNAFLYEFLRVAVMRPLAIRPLLLQGLALIALCGAVWGHGMFSLHRPEAAGEQFRVALIQSNIPEEIKWRPEAKEKILEIHDKLTQLASYDSPDLVVWPEASFPGYFNRAIEADKIRTQAQRLGTSILVGSPHYENEETYYNSAYLVRGPGKPEERYDKIHLVPFGEYIPAKFLFGWLMPVADALGVGDFSAGKKYTLFHLYDDVSFAVAICFEDIFPELSRTFAERGARFFVFITNDSWFGSSSAPYQHLAASIFRAVENGLPVVRVANTGVSALIDAQGRITKRISSAGGQDIFVTGQGTGTITLTHRKTFYRQIGYLFPHAIFILAVILYGASLYYRNYRKQKRITLKQ